MLLFIIIEYFTVTQKCAENNITNARPPPGQLLLWAEVLSVSVGVRACGNVVAHENPRTAVHFGRAHAELLSSFMERVPRVAAGRPP